MGLVKLLFRTMPLAMLLAASASGTAWGHFQVLIPSRDVVSATDGRTVELDMIFTHPMENGPVMPMGRPKQFGVLAGGEKHDLLDTVVAGQVDGKTVHACSARLLRPGDHVFYLEPAPYWEPHEKKMIIHYTKVVVDFLAQTGWDATGPAVEMNLACRYGLGTGNTFSRNCPARGAGAFRHRRGRVPERGRKEDSNEALVTQVIKAGQRSFAY